MRIDDLWAYIVANNAPFIAALTSAEYPLVTLTDKMRTRDPEAIPGDKVAVYLDAAAEDIEEDAPSFRIVKLVVEIYAIVNRAKEAQMREQSRLYAKAIENCLRAYPYFFSVVGRDYFEGLDGNPDLKAAKLTIECKYEEDI